MSKLTKAINPISSTMKKRVFSSFDEAKTLRTGDRITHEGSWRSSVIRDKHKAYLDQWGPMPTDKKIN